MELHVTNLGYEISSEQLLKIFSPFGEVASARIFIDYYTNQRRDFGFVRMVSRNGGSNAITGLDGTTINNRILSVKEVCIKPEN